MHECVYKSLGKGQEGYTIETVVIPDEARRHQNVYRMGILSAYLKYDNIFRNHSCN